ncbi:type I restriction enzyme HsdR N-terminal domain-containing protein [Isoptericola aurantiacus]|uniref:type I restriction enzyme HsdR N-terminal domain-containing protein n=1 Tax=Isoptericola aurantiacus TaxID=3377839 RepID=UPI00383B116D
MDFGERLASLASKIRQQKEKIGTEEATKNAFVMPFISLVLGYDVFDPNEVVPEYTADVGTKRGEKIDYAIVRGDEVQILIEVKSIGSPLSLNHASQLFRYFATSNARIAILTNGQHYNFYTDLERANRMDDKPFLQLDLLELDESLIPEVQKLTKESFDLDSVVNAAEELKYIGALKRALGEQFRTPDDEWVKALTNRVYDGSFTQRVREQFRGLVGKAMKQFLADQVNDRLKAALGGQTYSDDAAASMTGEDAAEQDLSEGGKSDDRGIETTLEEIEGYQIVRAIACSEVPPGRIVHRDTKSYMGVLLDDNNRKPIVRLHFNTGQKYVGLFDESKNEERVAIESLEEIYEHADRIRETVHRYR